MYTLDGVVKRYGSVSALAQVTCTIPTDGLTAVMGPSGSGKSTLVRILSFIERADEGTVRLRLGDDCIDSTSDPRPWPRVTCVFQKQFLWPHLSLRDNICLPLRAGRRRNIGQTLDTVIGLFDMSEFIDRFPNEVSGGQAQRVALARALALEPTLILIDEAHSGLDLEQQGVLNRHLDTLRQSGVGLFVVTHSLEFARQYADRVVVVERGTITESGQRSILDNPTSAYLRSTLGAVEQ